MHTDCRHLRNACSVTFLTLNADFSLGKTKSVLAFSQRIPRPNQLSKGSYDDLSGLMMDCAHRDRPFPFLSKATERALRGYRMRSTMASFCALCIFMIMGRREASCLLPSMVNIIPSHGDVWNPSPSFSTSFLSLTWTAQDISSPQKALVRFCISEITTLPGLQAPKTSSSAVRHSHLFQSVELALYRECNGPGNKQGRLCHSHFRLYIYPAVMGTPWYLIPPHAFSAMGQERQTRADVWRTCLLLARKHPSTARTTA